MENPAKATWKAGKPTWVAWLSLPNIHTAEGMARLPFDIVNIDMQHGLIDYSDAVPMVQAIAFDEPHACDEDGACSLYPGLSCVQHERLFGRGVGVVGTFAVSPGNFVLDPFKAEKGAGESAVLVPERELPKWGHPVKAYIEAFERARTALEAE